MKLLLISDTHNKHQEIPREYLENKGGDIETIIHAGDISGLGRLEEIEKFLEWFSKLNFKYKVFIPGNHDFYFERASEEKVNLLLSKYPNVIYLQDSGVELDGFKVWGSGITPWFFDWAFNRRGDAILPHWNLIPLDTDILVVHGGPKYVGHLNVNNRNDDCGCPYLMNKISNMTNLKLFVQGHIHEGYGKTELNNTIFVNASVLNARYEMRNRPIGVTIT